LGRWQEAVSVHLVSYLYSEATYDHRIRIWRTVLLFI